VVLEAETFYTDCFLSEEDISYTFTANGAAISNPPFSAVENTLTIYTSDALYAGVFSMLVEAQIGTVGVDLLSNTDLTFSVEIGGCCLVKPASGNLLADQTYIIQTDGSKTFTFDEFTRSNLSPATAPVAYSTSTLPSFVTFNSASRTFTFDSIDNADAAGSPYIIEVSARD